MSLHITINRCTNLRSVQKFVNQDPYVLAWIDDGTQPPEKRKIKTILLGGTDPTWHNNNEIHLHTTKPGCECHIQVWDMEVFNKDRLIAETTFSLALYEEDGVEELTTVFGLLFGNKPAGEVHLTMTYEPVPLPLPPSQPCTFPIQPSFNSSWKVYLRNNYQVAISILASPLLIYLFWPVLRFSFSLVYFSLWLILIFILVPIALLVYGPAWLGWLATYGLSFVTQGYPIVFGAIHVIPWIRFGERRLFFRVAVDDFYVGNPPNLGYLNPIFVSASRVICVGSVSFEDLWNSVRLIKRPMPLAKVPDFEMLMLIDVELLEVDGFTFDLEVARGRLNLNEMTRMFAVGDVAGKLGLLHIPIERVELDPRWPNVLEVQVVRAKTLLAMDANGLSDPYAIVQLRGEKHTTTTKLETLNPMWNSEIYRYSITDPSGVLHIQLYDRDLGMQSDYLGQWIITLKHLIMDPKHCVHSSITVDDDGWIDGWFPLANAKWQNVGKCGEINLKLRWRRDNTVQLPLPKIQKSMDQITENSLETKLRLGDMDELIDVLNHVPILFNFKLVMVRDAKLSIKDLFKSKSAAKRAMKKDLLSPSSANSGGFASKRDAGSYGKREGTSGDYSPGVTRRKSLANRDTSSTVGGSGGGGAGVDSTSNVSFHSLLVPPKLKIMTSFQSSSERQKSPLASTPASIVGAGEGPSPTNGTGGTPSSTNGNNNNINNRLKKFVSSSKVEGVDLPDSDSDSDGEDDDVKRPYVALPLIQWKSQFAPRHGDPGITVYKTVDRFFRGLAPKIAALPKLNMILVGQSTSGLFHILGDDINNMIFGGNFSILSAARNVANQANLTTQFLRHKTIGSTYANTSGRNDEMLALLEPMRIVSAIDDDFLILDSIMSGTLEVCWSGDILPAGAGYRWLGAKRTTFSPWIFEVKSLSVFCRRAKKLAKDRVLCMNLVVSVEYEDDEVTLTFPRGVQLHLRLYSKQDTQAASIEDWANAFKAVHKELSRRNLV